MPSEFIFSPGSIFLPIYFVKPIVVQPSSTSKINFNLYKTYVESKWCLIYDLSIRIKLFNRDWYDGVYDVITIGRFIKYDIQFHRTRKMILNMIYEKFMNNSKTEKNGVTGFSKSDYISRDPV